MKITTAFVILILAASIYAQTPTIQTNNNQKEAERIWELAIAAKGGRDKMLAVKNLFESSTSSYRHGFKKIFNAKQLLIVFPSKSWEWSDNRPSRFGLRMTMYNFETDKQYVLDAHQKDWELMPIEKGNRTRAEMTFEAFVLLETNWWKPTMEALSEGSAGGKKVDVIQVRLNGKRIDYAFDKQTHLPVKVSFYLPNGTGDKREHIAYNNYLSDYIEVSGIKVPTIVTGEDGVKEKVSYQFNVGYNEDIFKIAPLPIESAGEAWKVKSK